MIAHDALKYAQRSLFPHFGKMKVRQVTQMELTSWRIALKLGRDSARNRRTATTREWNTVLFTLKAKIVKSKNVRVLTCRNSKQLFYELVWWVHEHWIG